jgi:hypothetical protein
MYAMASCGTTCPWSRRVKLTENVEGGCTKTGDQAEVGKAVIDGALLAFWSNKSWADRAIAHLADEKLHVAHDPNTNSIAVFMKQVPGNLLSRWTDFLTTDGEKPWRNRDGEFVHTHHA